MRGWLWPSFAPEDKKPQRRRRPARTSWKDFQQAAAPVLADLDRAYPQLFRIVESPSDEEANAVLWTSRGAGAGLYLADDDEDEDATAAVARELRDAVTDVLRATWPGCPEHEGTHALDVDVEDDEAVWVCPESGDLVAIIGQLGAESSETG